MIQDTFNYVNGMNLNELYMLAAELKLNLLIVGSQTLNIIKNTNRDEYGVIDGNDAQHW